MITAKEFIARAHDVSMENVHDFMIDFAKLHVEAALNNIKKEAQLWDDCCAIIPYEKVVYPLENIK